MYIKSLNKGSLLGIVGFAMFVGIVGGSVMQIMNAQAQTSTPDATTQQESSQQPKQVGNPSQATHVGENGKKEELLIGETAAKVTAAALKAVPGGTIQRVETEVDGNGVYEAHMTKADGSPVTVFFDSNFKLTTTEEGKMKAR